MLFPRRLPLLLAMTLIPPACAANPPAAATPHAAPARVLLARTLETDWFQAPVAGRPTISLAIEGGDLVLSGSRKLPAFCMPGDHANAFTEGLWNFDCAEAFLLNPENGSYLEINLSPHGAWWACLFSAPRVRATPHGMQLPGVAGRGTATSQGWQTQWRIPLANLPKELAFSPGTTRANLTFCLDREPQRHLTLHDLGGGKPDFHRPEKWAKVE